MSSCTYNSISFQCHRSVQEDSAKLDGFVIELKNESLFVMRRMNITLEHVYKNQVILRSNLKKVFSRNFQQNSYIFCIENVITVEKDVGHVNFKFL